MLTALHITLPKTRGYRDGRHQNLPNRCFVVDDATCEASLILTEASLKYEDCASHESHSTKTRFCFGHVAISPHHGSIFVAQVVPMLHDLLRDFVVAVCGKKRNNHNTTVEDLSVTSKSSIAATEANLANSVQQRDENFFAAMPRKVQRQLRSMSRTVFIYGSYSATERRALFLHLANATALTLLQQTSAVRSQTQGAGSCEVFFSLVDLYHVWGVGDVLDASAVLHDSARLERLRREQPRRSVNVPKGFDFVEPVRQKIDGRGDASRRILRAVQRVNPPRALRTDAEREDHAVKSTLVLTFIVSKCQGTEVEAGKCGTKRFSKTGRQPREEREDAEEDGGRQEGFATEARFHIILLNDSSAAAHGRQGAQELGALATALQASVHWQDEAVTRTGGSTSLPPPPPPSTQPWAPLRESPLLLYLFESTTYYTRETERSLRNLRLSMERRRLSSDGLRSVSANTSLYSYGAPRSLSTSTVTSSEQHRGWLGADADNSHILDAIAAGIGNWLLVVCVNSGWDQYHQARSAFLFAQRATNQLRYPGALSKLEKAVMVSASSTENMSSDPFVVSPSGTGMQTFNMRTKKKQEHISCETIVPQQEGFLVERQLWSSPLQKETTEPRHIRVEESSNSQESLSDISPMNDTDNENQENNGDFFNDSLSLMTPRRSEHLTHLQQLLLHKSEQEEERGVPTHQNATESSEKSDVSSLPQTPLPASGLCSSPVSVPNCRKLAALSAEDNDVLRDVLRKQRTLLEENERLRALTVRLLSQQADEVREERGTAGLADICDLALAQSWGSTRTTELQALRKELMTATKKAQVLKKALSRSMDENRKMCHVIQRQLRQCFAEFPSVVQETVAKRDTALPSLADERIQRWEAMLKNTMERVLLSVRAENKQETEGLKEEETEEGKRERGNDNSARRTRGKRKELDVSVNDRQKEGRYGGSKHRTVSQESDKPFLRADVDAQVVQLLQLAYHLFLSEASAEGNDLLEEDREECGRAKLSLSQNVLDIFSQPRQQQEKQVKHAGAADRQSAEESMAEPNLCWKCRVHWRTRRNAAYTTFLKLLRSLCGYITADGTLARRHLSCRKMTKRNEKETYGEDEQALQRYPCAQDEGAILLQAHQLSASLQQQRTSVCEEERTAGQQVRNELERERERRRQLQDEIIQLRLQLKKYESKLAFIGETLKPKLSNSIVQLEHMMSERKKKEDLERQQRATLVTEVHKQLKRTVLETSVKPLSSSSLFPLCWKGA